MAGASGITVMDGGGINDVGHLSGISCAHRVCAVVVVVVVVVVVLMEEQAVAEGPAIGRREGLGGRNMASSALTVLLAGRSRSLKESSGIEGVPKKRFGVEIALLLGVDIENGELRISEYEDSELQQLPLIGYWAVEVMFGAENGDKQSSPENNDDAEETPSSKW